MSIEWTKQTFEELKRAWVDSEDKTDSDLSDDELARRRRYEEINLIVESDRIWPMDSTAGRNRFCSGLCTVLSRLPQEAFDKVEADVGFVFDEPLLEMWAVNVPAPYSASPNTIVFFRTCMDLAPKALIGLIAHEIAHSFVGGRDYQEDEKLADDKAREWGFGPELDCKESEKKRVSR